MFPAHTPVKSKRIPEKTKLGANAWGIVKVSAESGSVCREGLVWVDINWMDNGECLDLIEKVCDHDDDDDDDDDDGMVYLSGWAVRE